MHKVGICICEVVQRVRSTERTCDQVNSSSQVEDRLVFCCLVHACVLYVSLLYTYSFVRDHR